MSRKIRTERNNDEFDFWLNDMTDENMKNYIKYRIIKQIDWFEVKGRYCKNKYQGFMFASIIISSIIPVLSIFADGSVLMRTVIAILGSVVSVIGSYITLQNYKELWVEYVSKKSILQNAFYMYFNCRGDFDVENDKERNGKLIDICENYFLQKVN
ncbi:MAG: DUF4231 domain-containing protein [Lachnospiraceae bacterium]|nr:DUF4231 domain-containing protein [Lachnospiraceae bacterium]